jgi:intracellular sulfur oxidation DsrE/DsrF family protein
MDITSFTGSTPMENSVTSVHPVDRRSFIRNASNGVALGMLGTNTLHARPGPATTASLPAAWDMTWVDRLTGKYKAVFDSFDLNGGIALDNASVFMDGYREVYGATDADTQAVIVMRGNGVHMAFGDATWEKYGLAARLKTRGPANPFARQLAALRQRGAILLACNLAASYYAMAIAQAAGVDAGVVQTDVRENLIAGALLMPSGVFAVLRAEQAGCWPLKSA